MNSVIKKVDTFCNSLESKRGLVFTSLVIGIIILAFDMLYVTPKFEAAYHGLQYSLLSNSPFDFSTPNPLRYRILPAFIGYITFLRGNLFFIVPLIFTLLFISSIYWVYRKKGYSPIDSVLFTGFISFSCTVFIQLAAPGYTDVVFYFFIFLSFSFVKNIKLSSLFFALALLTHECCLFLLPGLFLYAIYMDDKSKTTAMKYISAYLLAIIPLLLYRYWISANTPVEYDLSFYFSEKNIQFSLDKALPLYPAGLFYAFKLFWFFPIYILYSSWKRKEFNFVLIILSILICDTLQLIIAFDITRMLCLGFPVILISAEKLRTSWSPQKFTYFALALTLMNFLVIQNVIYAGGIDPLLPSPYKLILHFLGANA